MQAFPGTITNAELNPGQRLGIYLNIQALESLSDVRDLAKLGALFGGAEGKDYLTHLANTAWWDEPDKAGDMMKAVEFADATMNRKSNPPFDGQVKDSYDVQTD